MEPSVRAAFEQRETARQRISPDLEMLCVDTPGGASAALSASTAAAPDGPPAAAIHPMPRPATGNPPAAWTPHVVSETVSRNYRSAASIYADIPCASRLGTSPKCRERALVPREVPSTISVHDSPVPTVGPLP